MNLRGATASVTVSTIVEVSSMICRTTFVSSISFTSESVNPTDSIRTSGCRSVLLSIRRFLLIVFALMLPPFWNPTPRPTTKPIAAMLPNRRLLWPRFINVNLPRLNAHLWSTDELNSAYL